MSKIVRDFARPRFWTSDHDSCVIAHAIRSLNLAKEGGLRPAGEAHFALKLHALKEEREYCVHNYAQMLDPTIMDGDRSPNPAHGLCFFWGSKGWPVGKQPVS